ncbi:patatin-like phospholipase family protein [Microbacterium timonense]|uniref:patatin-like phospholipase family protein n=1 Tax=Microbacterium timonense TaxID=2086576 RepID=UPI000D0EDB12|nr:patatin-like phospholipase family protein [Microbacterium timonense]
MNTTPSSHSSSATRALVLAGAGAAGNAWQLGLIAGLAEAGVDLTEADLIIGTSAGSTVAAQVTSGMPPAELFAAIRSEPVGPHGPRPGSPPPNGWQRNGSGPAASTRPQLSGPQYMNWSDEIIATATDAADMRRRIAAAALERDESGGAAGARWREVVSARLPRNRWPRRRVLIPALDARTGDPVVFDRDSGVELVDAVAASTSAMIPYPIGDNRYLNGGYRRSSNADLATGCARVVVLEPFGGRSRTPREWGMDLETQVAELRAGGSRVRTIFPDAGAGDVFNANALDPSTRRPAAEGGYAQAHALADDLAEFWG